MNFNVCLTMSVLCFGVLILLPMWVGTSGGRLSWQNTQVGFGGKFTKNCRSSVIFLPNPSSMF